MKNVAELTFDDLEPGDRFPLGEHTVTRKEIIEFAKLYDPQPMHLDDAGASANPVFERIAASGWHTAALMNRMVGTLFGRTRIRGLAGAGVEQLRWIEPVYADDQLQVSLEIVGVRALRSNPDRGLITMRLDARNQNDRLVATFTLAGLFERGPRNG